MDNGLRVRVATSDEMDAVYRLTHDEYVRMGYCSPQPGGRLIHYPHLDNIPETTVLVAEDESGIVGTNTATLDGPSGLHVDCDAAFAKSVEVVRDECLRSGRNLGCAWRIVTRKQCRKRLDVVFALIGETLLLFNRYLVHVSLYSFNPHHERIYSRLLGMETLARGECDVLGGAPAVLMRGDYWRMRECWRDVSRARGLPFDLATIG